MPIFPPAGLFPGAGPFPESLVSDADVYLPTWSFELADAATGRSLGELRDVHGRHLRFPLKRIPTFTGTIDSTNPAAPFLRSTIKTLIKAYENTAGYKSLAYVGHVITAPKTMDSNGGTISIASAGAGWRIGRRLIGKNIAGATFGTNPLSLSDRVQMAVAIINALNYGDNTNIFTSASDTGIRIGTITNSGSKTYVTDWRYKKAQEAISELAAPLDGFDWEIAPVEPSIDALGLHIGNFNAKPVIGTTKPNIIWEYGTGRRNIQSFTDSIDGNSLMTEGINLPAGYPDSTEQPIQLDDATARAEWGLHEEVVASDLQTAQLRSNIVQENLRIRRDPQRVYSMQPVAQDIAQDGSYRVPRYGTDFAEGDIMPFRAEESTAVIDSTGRIVDYAKVKTVDSLVRCYAVDIDIDDSSDQPTPTLTVVGGDS